MKKIMYISFLLFLVILSFQEITYYSYNCDGFNYIHMQRVRIEKTKKEDNNAFIDNIEKTAKEIGCDIAFFLIDDSDDRRNNIIYKTNNTDNFYNIAVEGGTQKLTKNECLSTKDQYMSYNCRKIYGLWRYEDYTILNFEEIPTKSLSSAAFFVPNEFTQEFADALTQSGYNATVMPDMFDMELNYTEYFMVVTIPFTIMLICIVLYFLLNGKAVMLKKLEGYSSSDIRSEEWRKNLVVFILIYAIVMLVLCIFMSTFSLGVFLDFLSFSFKRLLLALIIPVIIFVISSFIISLQNNKDYIKGKTNNKIILAVTLVLKALFVCFVLESLSATLVYANMSSNAYNANLFIENKTKGYAVTCFSGLGLDVETEEGYNSTISMCRKLYDSTVNKFNGVILYDDSFQMEITANGITGEAGDKGPGKSRIIVNNNYLKFNPLYKPNGELITEKDLDYSKFNFLVSDKKGYYLKDEIKSFVLDYLDVNVNDVNDNDINVIFYKEDQQIFTLDTLPAAFGQCMLDNPVIEIFDPDKDKYGSLLSFIAGNYYVKTTTDNPYNELLPYIEDAGLDNIILSAPSVASGFSEYLKSYYLQMISYIITSVLYVLGIIILSIFSIKYYFILFKNNIAVKKLGGYGTFAIHKLFFGFITATSLVALWYGIFMCDYINSLNDIYLWLLIAFYIIEIIGFYIFSKTLTRKNILETLKGS